MVGDLSRVIATGDRLRSLRMMRNHLAAQLEKAPPQNCAQITRELRAIIADLAELELTHKPKPAPAPEPTDEPAIKEAGALGDLSARIAARRNASTDPGSTAGGVQPRL